VRGLDLDLQWVPIRRLSSRSAAALLHSEYEVCTAAVSIRIPDWPSKEDFSGNELVRAPKLTGSAQASYTFDVWGGPLEIAGTAHYNDGYWFDAQNTFFQRSYSLFRSRVSAISTNRPGSASASTARTWLTNGTSSTATSTTSAGSAPSAHLDRSADESSGGSAHE